LQIDGSVPYFTRHQVCSAKPRLFEGASKKLRFPGLLALHRPLSSGSLWFSRFLLLNLNLFRFMNRCCSRPLSPFSVRSLFAAALVVVLFPTVSLMAEDSKIGAEPWVAPARAARKANPMTSDAPTLAAGKELFTQACLPCHGTQGKGDGPAAATLERNGKPIKPGNLSNPKLWEQTDGTIFWKVSEGRSPMPAFQESFSEEQRWKIVTYVRTLAPRENGAK